MALLIAALVVGLNLKSAPAVPDPATGTPGQLLSSQYDPPDRPVEVILDKGDGQIFATHATDPFLSHPERIRGGPAEQSYRFQRPLYGLLGWAGSFGRAEAAPLSLLALTVGSVALLVFVVARMLEAQGVDPRWTLVLLLAPGMVTDLIRIGPEALGLALVLVGFCAWRSDPWRPVVMTLCFGMAGLARETLLLAPAVLVVVELARAPGRMARVTRRRVSALLLSAVPWLIWVAFLVVHLGSLPSGAVGGRLSPTPFLGLIRTAPAWSIGDIAWALLILLPVAVGLARRPGPGLTALLLANVGLAALLGPAVWGRFEDYGRVLLPLSALSLLAITQPRPANPQGETDDDADREDVNAPDRSSLISLRARG